MPNEPTTPPLATFTYDGPKSGSGGRAGRGVELRVREVRRRNWSMDDRLRIVHETLEPGAVIQAVAARHDVSTGQLYTWRKQILATAVAGFVPVELVPDEPPLPPPILAAAAPITIPPAMIEITLASGTAMLELHRCRPQRISHHEVVPDHRTGG